MKEIIIFGGGLSRLNTAYELKNKKIGFKNI